MTNSAEERKQLYDWALNWVMRELKITLMLGVVDTDRGTAQRLADAAEKLLTTTAQQAREEALREAAKVADEHSLTRQASKSLGPEFNSTQIAKKIRALMEADNE